MTATAEELDLTIRSHRLHARRWGSPAAPLVLGVHGLSGNLTSFDFLGERLGGDRSQLVALDLRGRGHSETTPAGTYGWESHARDLFAVADALGCERFAIVGQSMGGSIAMKAAELDASRLDAIVLVDVAGPVDPGVGPVIDSMLSHLDTVYDSADAYIAAVKGHGLIRPWNHYWDRFCRYPLVEVDGGLRSRTDPPAVAEDRRYTATQDPHELWTHLTVPTLLLRATRELRPGAGYVVPEGDRDRFAREVRHGTIVEVDANHLTIRTHPHATTATARFLTEAVT